MIIYIEYAIADNLIIDYLLLKAAAALCKIKIKKFYMLLSAILGTVTAIFLPLFSIQKWAEILIKIITAAIMCLIICNKKSIFGYFKLLNAFILFTFILGGATFGILSVFGIKPTLEEYYSGAILPVGITVLICFLIFIGVKKSVEYYMDSALRAQYFECRIKANNYEINMRAFFDSGNLLKDNKSGLPIVVCNKKTAQKLLWLGGLSSSGRKIKINSACGTGTAVILDIDNITVKLPNGFDKTSNAMLGVLTDTEFDLDADLIIGACLI